MVRNKVNNYKEQFKSDYIEAQIVENKDNSSKLWKVLKTVTNTGGKNRDSVKTLKYGNMVLENFKDIANSFNIFFTIIGSNVLKGFKVTTSLKAMTVLLMKNVNLPQSTLNTLRNNCHHYVQLKLQEWTQSVLDL